MKKISAYEKNTIGLNLCLALVPSVCFFLIVCVFCFIFFDVFSFFEVRLNLGRNAQILHSLQHCWGAGSVPPLQFRLGHTRNSGLLLHWCVILFVF